MRYLPPIKHRGILAYLGSEITFWIVAAVTAGAISCAINEKYSLSIILAGVASFCVFLLVYRAGERAERGAGIYYCEGCQYYRSPGRKQEEPGAI